MSEQIVEKKEEKSNKKLIIIIAAAAFVVIAALVVVIVILLGKENQPQETDTNNNAPLVKYEPGAVILDQNDLQSAWNEAVQKTKDGYITLDFANFAESLDGENFICYIGNSVENSRDEFFSIYSDSSLSQELYVSGLVSPGSGIKEFQSKVKLDSGEYKAVLVITQVGDDHATMTSQVAVELTLNVR